MRLPPGTTIKGFHIDFGDPSVPTGPESLRPTVGDLLRNHRTGACYLIDDARPGRKPGRMLFDVTRLDVDAVQDDDPGVWLFETAPRRR